MNQGVGFPMLLCGTLSRCAAWQQVNVSKHRRPPGALRTGGRGCPAPAWYRRTYRAGAHF